ncbi:flagellar biosynthesis anti-sigma factor FlgM [Stakelama marina]|uniref:Negative regulator of flagellin synthesis n=1 Tax=Stakelama marina TaxID=2826939 RepID=A0A8T4IF85_9SPHN|nr:flagellar biosynthesis anti-sigma factor FlgM [Stakelama marina]MBR0553121.1 flagellar biosynthesis anti-sigma factor FlgM [Stakelama marina]
MDRISSPVAPAARAQRPANAAAQRDTSGLAATSRSFAKSPPVDAGRVATLRAQVQQGSYRIDAKAVANRMLAMRKDWTSNDAS